MTREEMVQVLLDNLYWMNQGEAGVAVLVEEQKDRYAEMTDLQIQNLFVINC